MKPLAFSFQLVIDAEKRLAAEIEIVYDDGTVVNRTVPANERFTVHFDEDEPALSIRPKPA